MSLGIVDGHHHSSSAGKLSPKAWLRHRKNSVCAKWFWSSSICLGNTHTNVESIKNTVMYWKYCLCWKKDLELNRDSRILWEFRMHNKIIQSPHGLPKQANCQYLMWLWFLKVPGIPSIKAICIFCFGLWWHMVKDPWRGFMLQVVLPKICNLHFSCLSHLRNKFCAKIIWWLHLWISKFFRSRVLVSRISHKLNPLGKVPYPRLSIGWHHVIWIESHEHQNAFILIRHALKIFPVLQKRWKSDVYFKPQKNP